jgi:hypothetical protein
MEKTGNTTILIDSITDLRDVGFFDRGNTMEVIAASPIQDSLIHPVWHLEFSMK